MYTILDSLNSANIMSRDELRDKMIRKDTSELPYKFINAKAAIFDIENYDIESFEIHDFCDELCKGRV
jgi:hypothetical protein